MDRRELLILAGGEIVWTAGCTTSETQHTGTPTNTPSSTPTATDESGGKQSDLTDEEGFNRLKTAAREINVEITYTFIGDNPSAPRSAYFEYMDGGKPRSERENDVRYFVEEFLSLVELGWDTGWLEASLMKEPDIIEFGWFVEPEWVDAFFSGNLSEDEVGDRAVDSIA